ncbi:MAG: SHOCT domain-containing protein [Oscillospiraceae bacterium]|nr:SHOCT domain-containing protein [Oscillospiraceae bacterium]
MKKSNHNSRAVWKLSGTFMLVVSIVSLSFSVVLIPSMKRFGVLWAVLSLLFLVASLLVLDKGRRRGDGGRKLPASAAPSAPVKRKREKHDHIPSMALDAKGRMEQLETLRSAGLLTDREYQERQKEILQDH